MGEVWDQNQGVTRVDMKLGQTYGQDRSALTNLYIINLGMEILEDYFILFGVTNP